jgi:two-component system OmpR family response regulator
VAVDIMKYGSYDYVVKGETAFSRMENVLTNVSELHKARTLNRGYKTTITILSIVIGAIILLSLYLAFFTDAYTHM